MVDLKLKLPDSFFEGEERDGYFVSSQMKKVWAVELDLLAEFMQVCEKYQIKWWLGYGNILGAARHKGFIPWDDDIDVIMMRTEYERFIKLCSGEFKPPYYLQSGEETCHCHLQLRNSQTTGILKSHLKHKFQFNQGIFIDIFPIDDKIEDNDIFLKQCNDIMHLRKKAFMYRAIIKGRPFHDIRKNLYVYVKTILYSVYYKINNTQPNLSDLVQMINYNASKYNNGDTTEVCNMILKVTSRSYWKREWFSDTIYLPFEIFKLPVPAGYKELLDCFYGDWHQYVRGASFHGSTFFDTNKSYTEYIKRRQ